MIFKKNIKNYENNYKISCKVGNNWYLCSRK